MAKCNVGITAIIAESSSSVSVSHAQNLVQTTTAKKVGILSHLCSVVAPSVQSQALITPWMDHATPSQDHARCHLSAVEISAAMVQ